MRPMMPDDGTAGAAVLSLRRRDGCATAVAGAFDASALDLEHPTKPRRRFAGTPALALLRQGCTALPRQSRCAAHAWIPFGWVLSGFSPGYRTKLGHLRCGF